jgi:hypothetical protein
MSNMLSAAIADFRESRSAAALAAAVSEVVSNRLGNVDNVPEFANRLAELKADISKLLPRPARGEVLSEAERALRAAFAAAFAAAVKATPCWNEVSDLAQKAGVSESKVLANSEADGDTLVVVGRVAKWRRLAGALDSVGLPHNKLIGELMELADEPAAIRAAYAAARR